MGFCRSLWVGDSHSVCVRVCVSDLRSLWDTKRRTWHVATRGHSAATDAHQQMLEGGGGDKKGGHREREERERERAGGGKRWEASSGEAGAGLMDG